MHTSKPVLAMVAIGDLLQPSTTRTPIAQSPAIAALVHLANPMRRALVRAIGYDSLPESYLRASYGPSWGAVQSDLRALVNEGMIVIDEDGHYSLDLTAFPRTMASSMFSYAEARAAA